MRKFTALILGPSGLGKTTSISTLLGNVVVSSFDPDGFLSLDGLCNYEVFEPGEASHVAAYLKERKDGTAIINYNVSVIHSILDAHTLDAMAPHQKAIFTDYVGDRNRLIKEPHIDAFVDDGLTGLSRIIKGYIVAATGKPKMTQEAWQYAIEKVTQVFEVCCGLPNKSYVLMCHVQYEEDALTGGRIILPLIFGRQLPHSVVALFNMRFLCEYNEERYWWRTKPFDGASFLSSRVKGRELDILIPQDFALFQEEEQK